MAWPEVNIEDFPPERDDEPASLRQDILDELTDHFVCALNRELLKNSDEQTAKQRVLNQFGDPIKIARQLWFDAMKERIMSQRIMTGISIVMAACCIAVVGIAWTLMKESQVVNQKMLEQLALIADQTRVESGTAESSQRTDEALTRVFKLFEESQKLAPGIEPGIEGMGSSTNKSDGVGEMHNISFQLVQETKEGKPAVGFSGKLTKSGTQTDTFTVEAVSNDAGTLDFGSLPWGIYKLKLTAPWDESYFNGKITVIPGRGFTETIVCPAAAPKTVPVQFQVDWPDKLKSEDWVLLCDFRIEETEHPSGVLGGLTRKYLDSVWYHPKGLNDNAGQSLVFLIDNQDQVSLCPLSGTVSSPGKYKVIAPGDLAGKPSIKLLEGDSYELPVINLFPKKDLVKLSALDLYQSFNVLNHRRTLIFPFNPAMSYKSVFGVGFMQNRSPTTLLLPFSHQASLDNLVNPKVQKPLPETASGIELSKLLTFSAAKDQKNVWEIKLPDLDQLKVPERVNVRGQAGGGQGFF